MKKIINFGIIGTSKITERFIDAAKLVEGFNLVAVYSRDINRAISFGKRYGAEYYTSSLEDLAEYKGIDAVYIASPNCCHMKQAVLMLNKKKHVICEKPLASNEYEVKKIIDTAVRNKVVFMEAMKNTLTPNYSLLKENLYKIGKIRRYIGNFCQYSSRYDNYKKGIIENAFKKELSNGSIMDIGIYCVYPMVELFGIPREISASAIFLDNGVDGAGTAICKYEDMDAILSYSKISNSYSPSEIQGEEGSIVIDKIGNFNEVKIVYKNGKEEIVSIKQNSNEMIYEVNEFISLIKTNKLESEINSHKASINSIRVVDYIRKESGIKFSVDSYLENVEK